jgi:hypothetical protein
LFAHGELNTRLAHTLRFNRFLTIAIIINLVVYSLQDSGSHSTVCHVLLSLSWIILGFYSLSNEILLWVTNKPDLSSQHSCETLSTLNTILTAALIIMLTVFTGNSDYIFLSLIPLIQGISYGKTKLSLNIFITCAGIILVANIFGWFGKSF